MTYTIEQERMIAEYEVRIKDGELKQDIEKEAKMVFNSIYGVSMLNTKQKTIINYVRIEIEKSKATRARVNKRMSQIKWWSS